MRPRERRRALKKLERQFRRALCRRGWSRLIRARDVARRLSIISVLRSKALKARAVSIWRRSVKTIENREFEALSVLQRLDVVVSSARLRVLNRALRRWSDLLSTANKRAISLRSILSQRLSRSRLRTQHAFTLWYERIIPFGASEESTENRSTRLRSSGTQTREAILDVSGAADAMMSVAVGRQRLVAEVADANRRLAACESRILDEVGELEKTRAIARALTEKAAIAVVSKAEHDHSASSAMKRERDVMVERLAEAERRRDIVESEYAEYRRRQAETVAATEARIAENEHKRVEDHESKVWLKLADAQASHEASRREYAVLRNEMNELLDAQHFMGSASVYDVGRSHRFVARAPDRPTSRTRRDASPTSSSHLDNAAIARALQAQSRSHARAIATLKLRMRTRCEHTERRERDRCRNAVRACLGELRASQLEVTSIRASMEAVEKQYKAEQNEMILAHERSLSEAKTELKRAEREARLEIRRVRQRERARANLNSRRAQEDSAAEVNECRRLLEKALKSAAEQVESSRRECERYRRIGDDPSRRRRAWPEQQSHAIVSRPSKRELMLRNDRSRSPPTRGLSTDEEIINRKTSPPGLTRSRIYGHIDAAKTYEDIPRPEEAPYDPSEEARPRPPGGYGIGRRPRR